MVDVIELNRLYSQKRELEAEIAAIKEKIARLKRTKEEIKEVKSDVKELKKAAKNEQDARREVWSGDQHNSYEQHLEENLDPDYHNHINRIELLRDNIGAEISRLNMELLSTTSSYDWVCIKIAAATLL